MPEPLDYEVASNRRSPMRGASAYAYAGLALNLITATIAAAMTRPLARARPQDISVFGLSFCGLPLVLWLLMLTMITIGELVRGDARPGIGLRIVMGVSLLYPWALLIWMVIGRPGRQWL